MGGVVCHYIIKVDIVTEWNLKQRHKGYPERTSQVDIVTEWNLKFFLN